MPVLYDQRMTMEPLLLSTTKIFTYLGDAPLTNATGFFFQRDDALYLVTSQHVFHDEPNHHLPDRIEISFHVDPDNATQTTGYSIPLYRNGVSQWIAGSDSSGDVDIAAIKIDPDIIPSDATYTAFTPDNLLGADETIEIGSSMLIVGFPLGFHDTFHKLPVVRHAINASSLTMRFQDNGYFLTDARTHRGSSGASVVCRDASGKRDMPWILLGVHSARFDIPGRDEDIDEALGLNCAWFADILMALTKPS